MSPEKILTILRESHPFQVAIFTLGSCYNLYLLLKEIFPSAVAYYDMNHIITRIGDTYYDITGIVDGEGYFPFEDYFDQAGTDQAIKQMTESWVDLQEL